MGLFDWLKGEQAAPAPPVNSGAPTAEDIEAALERAEKMAVSERVPTPVLARVLRISTMTKQILPRLSNLGLDSQDAYTVVATATDYLPESLGNYVSLPRDWADTRPVANGKSSLLLLVDQLDLLGLTVSRMIDATNRSDAAGLVAQGAFLAQKFGTPGRQTRIEPPAASDSGNPLDL